MVDCRDGGKMEWYTVKHDGGIMEECRDGGMMGWRTAKRDGRSKQWIERRFVNRQKNGGT